MDATQLFSNKMQTEIIRNAYAAVRSIVSEKYPTFFTDEEIKDIVGNVNYKACRSIGSYDPSWAISTWIGKIARNCVLDEVDHKMKRLPISQPMFMKDEDGKEYSHLCINTYRGDEFEADRELIMEEFTDAVDYHAEGLSERDKSFFKMMKEEMKPIEMAEVEGCNANVAAMHSCYIRKGLKQPLAELAKEYGVFCKKLAS